MITQLRKFMAVGLVTAVSFSTLAFLPQQALAAVNIALSPSTGSVGDTLTVSAVVNTGGEAILGVDFNLNFTGPVSFVSSTAGNIGCTPLTTLSSGKINVLCLIPPGSGYTGSNGVVGSFTFRATSSGTSVLTITDFDPGPVTVGVSTGGVYSVGVAGGGTLPQAGILDHKGAIVGITLFVIALFVAVPEVRNRFGASQGWAVKIVRE